MERQIERGVAAFDDATVTAKVQTALIADDSLKALSIDVDTSQNVVTLRGSVTSEDLKRRAEQLARGIEGVKEVRNELTIKQPVTARSRGTLESGASFTRSARISELSMSIAIL